MADYVTIEEYNARIGEIEAERNEIDKRNTGQRFSEEDKARWNELSIERKEHLETVAELTARLETLEEQAQNPEAREAGQHRVARPTGRQSRVPENIHDIASYRANTSSDSEHRQALRDGALKAVDRMQFPHDSVNREDAQAHMARLLDTIDGPRRDGDDYSPGGSLARRILRTSDPNYVSAFGKYLAGAEASMTAEEQRALGIGSQGGNYPVPIMLDPSVILTSNGQVNPIRQISRVVQTTGNTWNGVASAGISASYGAEAVEATDNSPTLTQPAANVEKAKAFVPFSIEEGEDWGNLQSEMARLLVDAKDALEATKFLSGLGHSSQEPQGLLVGATQTVISAATATFAVADLYSLVNALPDRWQPNASLVAHRAVFNKVRQFDTSGGASLWVQLAAGQPQRLLDYPTYRYSSMSSAVTTSAASIMVCGDFNQFLILDRIGLNIELIPHLFGTVSNYPTGQRGLYAYWRNTSAVLVQGAFKTLKLL